MATMETTGKTFTDEQVTEACGINLDSLRRLITWRAVRPVQGGGGRGRVRLWTMRQALRIAVTAEFFQAGFSLQMAHTITYCLPLDDMLTLYQEDFVEQYAKTDYPGLIDPEAANPMPHRDAIGTETYVVNGRYIYSDALAETPTLFAMIDLERNRVVPTWSDPRKPLWGLIFNNNPEYYKDSDFVQIDQKSLLIDEEYFQPYGIDDRDELERRWKKFREMSDYVDTQIIAKEWFNFRSFLQINLNIGLYITYRKLVGLPVDYHLRERPEPTGEENSSISDEESSEPPRPDEES
jgi:hypothetical protein